MATSGSCSCPSVTGEAEGSESLRRLLKSLSWSVAGLECGPTGPQSKFSPCSTGLYPLSLSLACGMVPYAQDPAVLAGEGHGLESAYWAPIVKHSGILPDLC